MSNTYNWSKVSRETLERVAAQVFAEVQRGGPLWQCDAVPEAAQQALVPPLRTRAEVDAHLVRVVRTAMPAEKWRNLGLLAVADLVDEPLAPDPNNTDAIQQQLQQDRRNHEMQMHAQDQIAMHARIRSQT
jgi:hypothetical protein